jgi:WD40 repeat protein
MFLEKQFIVSSENLSEEINVGNRYKLGMKELGLTSLSSCGEDPTTFVFSTHGSFIFQGFLLNDVQVSDTSVVRSETYTEDPPLYDPVTNVVVQEIGLIVAIDCSPFHRNLFAYLTKEGSCFVQNLLKPNSPSLSIALEVDSRAADVKWSTRPMMIAVADRNFLRFYDLKEFNETARPALELEHDEPLLKIAFNKSRTDLVAASDAAGFVHIWKMPSKLTEASTGEIDDLILLGQSHGKSS